MWQAHTSAQPQFEISLEKLAHDPGAQQESCCQQQAQLNVPEKIPAQARIRAVRTWLPLGDSCCGHQISAADTFPGGDRRRATSPRPEGEPTPGPELKLGRFLPRPQLPGDPGGLATVPGPGCAALSRPARAHTSDRGSSTTNTSPDSSGTFSRCPLACLSNRPPPRCHGGTLHTDPARHSRPPAGQPRPATPARAGSSAGGSHRGQPPGPDPLPRLGAGGTPASPHRRRPRPGKKLQRGPGGGQARPGPAALPGPLEGWPGPSRPPTPPRRPRREGGAPAAPPPPSPSWAPSCPPAATAACPQLPAPTPPFLLLERPRRRKRLHRPLATRRFPTAAAILAEGGKRKRR